MLLLRAVLFKHRPSIPGILESMTVERLQFRLAVGTNLTPFKTIGYYLSGHPNYRSALYNLAGNMALFGPMGFLLPVIFPRLDRPGRVAGVSAGMVERLFAVPGDPHHHGR